jgi:hypothetical protein
MNDLIFFTGVFTELEFDMKPQGEIWGEIMKVRRFVKDIFFNPYDHYRVDKLLFDECLYVDKNHEKNVIEREMILARRDIGKVFGISNCVSFFVYNKSTQDILKECDYTDNFSMAFKKLPKYICEGFFPGISDENLKIMSINFY